MKWSQIFTILTLLSLGSTDAQSPARNDDHMSWWREAKFGLFIHWGVYAVPARKGEWVMHNEKIPVTTYRAFAKDFNPVKYDPAVWAALAKEAGMRYVVITAKHHEGFALYPSEVTDWDVADASPYKNDLLGPLLESVHEVGLKMGFYYSQAQDWVHPGGAKKFHEEGRGWDEAHKGSFDAYLKTIALPQTRELITRYQPDVFWWDTPDWMTPERAAPFQDAMKLRPGIITNNRLGGGFRGDMATPEQYVPVTGYSGDWETCMTIGRNWGYTELDTELKSTAALIRKLASICSRGGNFLLNVGPTAQGEIPSAFAARLRGVGQWLKIHGESIYGSTAGPFAHLSWGCATRKGDKLYLHVFEWPENRKLRVPLLSKAAHPRLLKAPDQELTITREAESLVIDLPATPPDPANSVIILDLPEEPVVQKIPTVGAKVSASSAQPKHEAKNAIDGTEGRRWRAAEKDKSARLNIDLLQPVSINGFGFDDPRGWPRLKQRYKLMAEVNGEWRELATGRTTGHGALGNFPPVVAQKLRLHLTYENGAPGVSEFQLYRSE